MKIKILKASATTKLKVILLLYAMYPLYSYGTCEALFKDMVQVEFKGESALDIQYEKAVSEYIKKYNENYRPEAFFTKAMDRIKNKFDKDSLRQRQIMGRARRMLSIFNHYDESIKLALMKLVDHKYTPSFYCLGFVHERGIGTKVNYVEAWAWFMTAFAVDGVEAKEHLTRVWKYLTTQDELNAKILADKYIRLYTEIPNTPSVTIIE